VVTIQRYWRRGLAYKELRALKRQKIERELLILAKAMFLQRFYRGYRGRKRVREIKLERQRWKEMGAKLEIMASIKIQVGSPAI
jgi:hypothetical protein